MTSKRWLQPALYALPFVAITALLTLPWAIYTDFVREGQYGLMNHSFARLARAIGPRDWRSSWSSCR